MRGAASVNPYLKSFALRLYYFFAKIVTPTDFGDPIRVLEPVPVSVVDDLDLAGVAPVGCGTARCMSCIGG